ncbi:hypothetical protein [Albidovulum sp.]
MTTMGREFTLALPVMLLAALVTGLAFWQPMPVLDAIYLPDDTYYTLAIARNLAAGSGPSAGGGIVTSGFQPLIAFLAMPVFLAGLDGEAAVAAVIALSGLFGVLAAGMAAVLIGRWSGSRAAALAGGAFMATSPLLLSNNLNGLETSLAGFLALLALALADRIGRQARPGRAVGLGVVIGLALLARIDSALIVLLIGLMLLVRAGIRPTAVTVAAALVTVAPWWLYCLATFGSVVPESGEAVRQITAFHREQGLTTVTALLYGLAVAGLFVMPLALPVGLLPQLAVILLLAVPILGAVRRRRVEGLAVLAAAGFLIGLLYVFHVPAFWFFERYFYLLFLALAVAGAVLGARLARRAGRGAAPIAGLAGAGLVALNLVALAPYLQGDVTASKRGIDGVKGYAASARAVLAALPAEAVVGAMQSGAIAFFAPLVRPGVEVVNLDGVVNGAAHAAIRAERLADYLEARRVSHFADWELNRRMLERYLGPGAARLALEPVADMPPQDPSHRFRLWRLRAAGAAGS